MMMAAFKQNRDGWISLLVLLAVVFVLCSLLLGPVVYQAERYRSELRKDERILTELRAIEAVQDEIKQVQQSYQERDLQSWGYTGLSLGAAGLDVQRRVSGWLEQVQTQRVTPVTAQDVSESYAAVGVQVQFIAAMDELLEVLEHIEQARPLLVVEQLRITPRAVRRTSRQPQPPQMVSVQMTVQAYVATGEQL